MCQVCDFQALSQAYLDEAFKESWSAFETVPEQAQVCVTHPASLTEKRIAQIIW